MPTATDVANYFLAVQNQENDITNLKLQKLCSYAQALSLALLQRPLFSEALEAWTHGPVVPTLYWQFNTNEKRPIPPVGLSEKYARAPFDDEEKFILELVNSYYGAFSAWELRERSHRDFPGDFGSRLPISNNDILEAFSTDPLVIKMRENQTPVRFDPKKDKLVSEREVWDALAL